MHLNPRLVFFFFFAVGFGFVSCWILVSCPGIKATPSAVRDKVLVSGPRGIPQTWFPLSGAGGGARDTGARVAPGAWVWPPGCLPLLLGLVQRAHVQNHPLCRASRRRGDGNSASPPQERTVCRGQDLSFEAGVPETSPSVLGF